MRIAVLIPDRGDRPALMANCLRMMHAQTLEPHIIFTSSFKAENDDVDITKRYRFGYDALRGSGVDLIAWIENDDWYDPNYLQDMAELWEENGRPDVMGTSQSIYYHIGLKKYKTLQHFSRSAAMNTFVRPDLDIKWPVDSEAYTDVYLYHHNPQLRKAIVPTKRIISMGIKHSIGKCGGHFHSTWLDRFDNDDADFTFLRGVMDTTSAEFYTDLHEKIRRTN